MADDTKTQIAIRLADELLTRVDAYRTEVMSELPGHDFTRVDAIRVLLERGLARTGHGTPASKAKGRRRKS